MRDVIKDDGHDEAIVRALDAGAADSIVAPFVRGGSPSRTRGAG